MIAAPDPSQPSWCNVPNSVCQRLAFELRRAMPMLLCPCGCTIRTTSESDAQLLLPANEALS